MSRRSPARTMQAVRPVLALFVALFLTLTTLLVATPAPAQATVGGDITGRVLDDLGQDAQGVTVAAIAADDPQQQVVGTSTGGSFRIAALPPGDYRVRASGPTMDTAWFPGTVTVQANLDASVGTLTVPRGADVSGQVWDQRGYGVWPTTVRFHRVRDGVTDSEPSVTVQTRYDSYPGGRNGGRFLSVPLTPGTYRLHFTDTYDNHAAQWYGGFATPEQSPTITLDAGQSVDLGRLEMKVGGSVTVPVVDEAGFPINPSLVPWVRVGDTWLQRGRVEYLTTGRFRIDGLGGRSFRLQMLADRGANTLETWYGGASSRDAAADVESPYMQDVTVPPLTVQHGGVIRGTVRNTAGDPVAAPVSAWRRTETGGWTLADSARSDDQGNVSLQALPTGTYQVRTGGSDGWAIRRSADLAVTAGEETAAGDLTAYVPSGVSGKVLDEAGNRVRAVEVEAWQQVDGTWTKVATTWSDDTGNYTLASLDPGQVKLYFRSHDQALAGQWHGPAPLDLASSEAVTLGEEQQVININQVLHARPTVQGVVRAGTDTVWNAQVEVLRETPSGLELYSNFTTGSDGSYAGTLPALGRYVLHVTAPGHTEAWYGGTSASDATRIPATAGQTITADLMVNRLPFVSGYVADANGEVLPRVDIELWRQGGESWTLATSTVATTGNFALPQVEPGRYRLRAADAAGDFLARWYPGVADAADATVLDLGYNDSRSLRLQLGARGVLTTSVPLAIGGPHEIGDTMQVVSALDWNVQPDSVRYVWLRNGEDTLDGYQHTIASNDIGTRMSVHAVARKAGYITAVLDSNNVLVPGLKPLSGWGVMGKPVIGKTLRLRVGTWATTPTKVLYRWWRDGIEIPGATGPKYTLRRADGGHKVALRVTAKRAGYPNNTFLAAKPLSVPRAGG